MVKNENGNLIPSKANTATKVCNSSFLLASVLLHVSVAFINCLMIANSSSIRRLIIGSEYITSINSVAFAPTA